MKILIISNHSYMLYRFRKELIQHLMIQHEVVLSMPFAGHEQDFTDLGLRCVSTQMARREIHPAGELKLFLTYWRMIRSERPDCVITYSIKPNIYAGLCCRILRIPYFANVQGLGTAFEIKKLEAHVTRLYRQAMSGAQMVFFENRSNALFFQAKGIVPPCRQTVLPGAGVNLDEYPVMPYPDHETFHFLYLGRIMREKGIFELFSAARQLHKKYGSRVFLDIVGFFDCEDLSVEIHDLEALGIAKYHGFQFDPRPFYSNADCVVVPSYHEGMSNVILESAAMGRPVIASRIPGCMEAVDAERSGYLCRSRDPSSLYSCMEKMLLLPREERARLGQAGRGKMEREFDRKDVIRQVMRSMDLEAGFKE